MITGRLNMSADYERLQQHTLKALLLERGLTEDDIKSKDREWEEQISELHANLPGADTGNTELTPREKYQLVEQSITVSDDQLLALAGQRAVAVKAYLVNEAGLAPERAVVAQANLKQSDNEFSGVELGIE